MCQRYLKSRKMFSIFGFLFAALAFTLFTEAYVIIPNDSGLVTGNNFPSQVTQMTPRNSHYPQMTPLSTIYGNQPIPQYMSDPSNINGVNSHIFPRQMPQMMMQGNAYNPYVASQQEMQRSQHLSPMLNPIMQEYPYRNQMAMPMPIPVDQFSQQVAFLIQSAIARLKTYVAFANQFIPNFSYNEPFMSNMGQTSPMYPMPYTQQFQPKAESQEVLGEKMLETQLQHANEQQQVIENDHRAQDEYEDELENRIRLQLEEEEIEKEKKEAEEKIKQEEEEEKERQDLEQKLREEQELRLIQIEEEKSKNKMINATKRKVLQNNRSKSVKPKVSETQNIKPIELQNSEVTDIKGQIKILPKIKNLKQQSSSKPGK